MSDKEIVKQLVYLMIYKPDSVALWVDEGKCNAGELSDAIRLVEDNKLLSDRELTALVNKIDNDSELLEIMKQMLKGGSIQSLVEKMKRYILR